MVDTLDIEYRKPIAHGTSRGYQQHLERRVDLCDSCRIARREYLRFRKAQKALKPRQVPVGQACGEKRGMRAGYQRHYNAGQPACDPCRKAHADYGAVYKRNRKKQAVEPASPPKVSESFINAEVTIPLAVLGALLSAAPTEVEEWAEAAIGVDVVTRAITASEAASRTAA